METTENHPLVQTFHKVVCRYCGTNLPEPFLELGTMPLANAYVPANEQSEKEFTCPLSLIHCPSCHLIQLSHVVPPELMFSHYLYVSSTTRTFQEHFRTYAASALSRIKRKESLIAVDIGSNDGLLVSCFEKAGMRAVGVEPAKNLSESANQNGIRTINKYFDDVCAHEIKNEYGKAGVITANNVFAHIDDVKSVCRNVKDLLSEQGIFIIEFPYLGVMLKELLFDMIYHEHLSYISVTALDYFLNQEGLQIFDIEEVSSHGGSLRVYISRPSHDYKRSKIVDDYKVEEKKAGYDSEAIYLDFARKVEAIRSKLIRFVKDAKKAGKLIAGYGAPAKSGTIINYCGLNQEDIEYIVDDNPLKQNMLSPGARIPIVPSSHLEKNVPDILIIFAWNFANEIISKIKMRNVRDAQFIVPLPEPKIVNGPYD